MNLAVNPRYKNIVILCPVVRTGGPEALHQLATAISDLGGKVSMLYFLSTSTGHTHDTAFDITQDKFILIDPPKISGNLYDQYPVNQITEFALTDSTLVIVPEAFATVVSKIPWAIKAVWWLSVDNSFLLHLDQLPSTYTSEFFKQHEILHFYQSEYAKHALQLHGAKQRYALSDYVNSNVDANGYTQSRNTIVYYPRKGKQLAEPFRTQHLDLQFVPIEKMTRAQVDQTLTQAGVYIDFGHHPGKDRVPREAARAGAVVLLRKAGSANFFEDHPLTDEYFFTDTDVKNGNLYNKVKQILSNRSLHFDRQIQYRTTIALEKQKFYLEVCNIFFESRQ
jgi:hypothetical protein